MQEDHFSFLYSLLMLVFDGILYVVVIWYIDAVLPGKYGTAKPWGFPFHLSYWVGKSRAQPIASLFARKRMNGRVSVSAEDEENGLLNPMASDTEGVCGVCGWGWVDVWCTHVHACTIHVHACTSCVCTCVYMCAHGNVIVQVDVCMIVCALVPLR